MTISTMLGRQTRLAEPLSQLWSEVKSNRRVVLGIVAIAALLAAYGLALLEQATESAEAAYRDQRSVLNRIAAVAEEHDWPQREAASAALRTGMEQHLWTADSEGLAQANLQGWISGIGREVGLPMFDIRMETAKVPDLPPDLRQITATITAQPSESAVISLLERLDRAPYLTVVSRLRIRQQSGPMLELVLTGYARVANRGGGNEQ